MGGSHSFESFVGGQHERTIIADIPGYQKGNDGTIFYTIHCCLLDHPLDNLPPTPTKTYFSVEQQNSNALSPPLETSPPPTSFYSPAETSTDLGPSSREEPEGCLSGVNTPPCLPASVVTRYFNASANSPRETNVPKQVVKASTEFDLLQGTKWAIQRRFKDFAKLHAELKNRYETLPPFPPRFFQQQPKKRRPKLEQYLNAVLTMDCAPNPLPKTPALHHFIQPTGMVLHKGWTLGMERGNRSKLERRLLEAGTQLTRPCNKVDHSRVSYLISIMDTNTLAHIFSFLPERETVKSIPLVCTSFWLAAHSPALWKGLKYVHVHAPVDNRLDGLIRLLQYCAAGLQILEVITPRIIMTIRLISLFPIHPLVPSFPHHCNSNR